MTVYTLFSQAATGSSLAADSSAYTMGVEFTVSVTGATLTAVWFYSATGAGNNPDTIALYTVSGSTLIHSEGTSGTPIGWSGAAGSGWIRAAFASPPSLTSGTHYKACVFDDAASGNWYSATANYWSSGPGSGGASSGPLSAPNNASATGGGQDTFTQTVPVAYPATAFNAGNYWVDPEVTTAAPGPPAAQVAAFMSSM